MSRPIVRRLQTTDSDSILADLSTRQYLNPHLPLERVLSEAQSELGFCPAAAQTAMNWLHFDGARAIGRFRRAELIQLARSIHRYWHQAVEQTAQSQPL
jgi:hypothetical protein